MVAEQDDVLVKAKDAYLVWSDFLATPVKELPDWDHLRQEKTMLVTMGQYVVDMNKIQDAFDSVCHTAAGLRMSLQSLRSIAGQDRFMKDVNFYLSRLQELKMDLLEKKKSVTFTLEVMRSMNASMMNYAKLGSGIRHDLVEGRMGDGTGKVWS
jgi:hypothetical protein